MGDGNSGAAPTTAPVLILATVRTCELWLPTQAGPGLNGSMNTETGVPGHSPPQTEDPTGREPKRFRTAAAPPSAPQNSDPRNATPRQKGHAMDSLELLFCLPPRAVPKQWELNIYKEVTVECSVCTREA